MSPASNCIPTSQVKFQCLKFNFNVAVGPGRRGGVEEELGEIYYFAHGDRVHNSDTVLHPVPIYHVKSRFFDKKPTKMVPKSIDNVSQRGLSLHLLLFGVEVLC